MWEGSLSCSKRNSAKVVHLFSWSSTLYWLNRQSLSKLREISKDGEAWLAAVRGITKIWTRLSDWTTATLVAKIQAIYSKHCGSGRGGGPVSSGATPLAAVGPSPIVKAELKTAVLPNMWKPHSTRSSFDKKHKIIQVSSFFWSE